MSQGKTIKVLQVFGALNMGGAESRMMDIYRHIDRKNTQFDFVSLSQGKQHFEEEIHRLGGKIYKIQSPRECGILKHISELRRCMREGHYDAVHAHTSYHCGIAMLAAKMEHIPVRISHARTTGSTHVGTAKKIFLKLGRALISSYSTHRFAISRNAGTFLFGKKSFEVIPNAIDFENYRAISGEEMADLKNNLKIPDSAFVIGQIGRFASMKNHRFTLNWFRNYLEGHPESRLVLVGDGPLKAEMEKLAVELKIKDKVIFTGVRTDVNKLLHIFDVLIFPSLYEGLGGVAIEAQAAGVPCVQSLGVPAETDLGLNLIQGCDLNASEAEWTKKVEEARQIHTPTDAEIRAAFDRSGYSLESVAQKYLTAYRSIT